MPPAVQVPEPGNFFEAQAAQQQIARFSGKAIGADASGSVEDASGKPEQPQEMQMLVAVRLRPLWERPRPLLMWHGPGRLLRLDVNRGWVRTAGLCFLPLLAAELPQLLDAVGGAIVGLAGPQSRSHGGGRRWGRRKYRLRLVVFRELPPVPTE